MTKTILFKNVISEFIKLQDHESIRFEYKSKHVRMTGYNDRGDLYIEYVAVLNMKIDKIKSSEVHHIKNIQKVTNLNFKPNTL